MGIGAGYPSIEDVFNSVRVHINDTFAGATDTVGEGRIFVDSWTPSITILNLALSRLQRDLENYGVPRTREETFAISGLQPINSASGVGVPNPAIQVYLGFDGYFDGLTLHATPTLPLDLLVPLKIGQRITNSGNVYIEVRNAPDGLPSMNQNYLLGYWEFRNDKIYFNGSQNTMDIELRYTAGVPYYATTLNPNLFATTYIPFLDSLEALSYRIAYVFCSPRLPKGGADELQSNYESAMLQMANRWIKTAQRTPVVRQDFGNWGGAGSSGEGW